MGVVAPALMLLVLACLPLAQPEDSLKGENVCKSVLSETYYTQEAYQAKCKLWGWTRCTTYRHVRLISYRTQYYCCAGYTKSGTGCIPICNGVGGDKGCNAPYGKCAGPNACVCKRGYYGKECKACPSLDFCNEVQCTSSYDVTCHKCEGEGSRKTSSLFWPVNRKTVCRATCSYNQHWCWPGRCSDQLSSSCQCAPGFQKVYSTNAYTKCQLSTSPRILTCKLEGTGNTTVETMSGSPMTCQKERDVYLNFIPRKVKVTLHVHLDLKVDQSNRPPYISSSSFGLSGGSVGLLIRRASGGTSTSASRSLGTAGTCDRTFSRDTPTPDLTGCTLELEGPESLGDGDWLCVELEIRASGYLRYKDFSHTVSSKQLYRETSSAPKQLCLRYDSSAPVHCSAASSGACNSRPIEVGGDHVITSPNVSVAVSGWSDPLPLRAGSDRASGLEKMTLTLHHVKHASTSQLQVDHDILLTLDVTNGTGDVILPHEPALYALELEVKDAAHNVRLARTLVLYDNSSSLELRPGRELNVTSARLREKGFWQAEGSEICVSWAGRFYNSFHAVSNFLLPLKPDPRGLVSGPYEHPGPQLPITGTPNVDGVTSFTYSVKVNSAAVQGETTLSDLQEQAACYNETTKDGDLVEVTVSATDVMDHAGEDSVGVHVDRSAPEVALVSRAPGLESSLYVHGSRDLSRLVVRLEALDPHSGLVNLRWTLGHRETPGDIGSGTWPSHRLAPGRPCPSSRPCYCPIVGACEFYNYSLAMEKLLHTADHNRDYVFTVTAENAAGLRTEVELDILVDASPPELGAVWEGGGGPGERDKDQDFTSSDLLHVRWSGFLDHESGVFKYRVGLGPRCLSAEELSAAELEAPSRLTDSSLPLVQEVMDTTARFPLHGRGKFYSTVVAYNKALMTSRPVCSDGVTRDLTPPVFHNVTIRDVGTRERVVCLGNDTYLLQRNASLVHLDAAACGGKCPAAEDVPWLAVLPVGAASSPRTYAESAAVCQLDKDLSPTETYLYLPNSNVFLDWDVEEEESQIQETLVGFGSSSDSPDLEDFRQTFSHHGYHHNHEGLPTATPLYVFLRATNKAGLATDVTLGPLVVDETPPRVSRPFSVSTNSSAAHLVVQPSDFEDVEEDVEALELAVHVGWDEDGRPGVLPPLPQERCPSWAEAGSRCCTASLGDLRRQAGESPRDFYFLVQARDLAGHVTTARSSAFSVPSLLPPGQGRVFDLDPENPVPSEDVDFQASSTTVCVNWEGFRSHDDVTFYVGVGTATGLEDVEAFSPTQSGSSQTCLSGLDLQPHARYVTTVKAVSLAGVTLVSSDGVTVLSAASFPALQVWDGPGCRGKEASALTVPAGGENASTATAHSLHPGVAYTLVWEEGVALNVTSPDVVWLSTAQESSQAAKPFLALSHSAEFQLDPSGIALRVMECIEDVEYTWQNSVSAHWNFSGPYAMSPTHFSVSLLRNKCFARKLLSGCLDTVAGFEDAGHALRHEFQETNLTADSTYHVAVRSCFGHVCGNASLSNGVQYLPHSPTAAAVSFSVEGPGSACPSFSLHWQPFLCGDSMAAPHYHVTMAEVDRLSGQETVFLSRGVSLSDKSGQSVKSECRARQTDSPMGVRGCVIGVCPSGQHATACHLLTPDPDPTPLYDLDTGRRPLEDVVGRHGYESSDERTARLQAEDVDFVRTRAVLAAVLDQDWEGAVDWFLMTGTEVPDGECDQNSACVYSTTTSGKSVELPELNLQDGQRYQICARRSGGTGRHGNGTAALVCSDGFLADGVAPPAPELRVLDVVGGFLRSRSVLHLQWSHIIDLDLSGHEAGASGIASVAFSVGSVEGGSDLHRLTASPASSALLHNLSLPNGLTCHANLKVTDRVGLTRVVSRKVVVDTTGPTLGHVTTGDLEGYVTSHVMDLRWGGFEDAESGIRHFLVEVSSQGGHGDVFPARRFRESSATLRLRYLVDGHRYKLAVSAVNGAGLTSTLISDVTADASPPTPGFVTTQLQMLEAGARLRASWEGFQDGHSGVGLYRAGLGRQPSLADLEPLVHLGLSQTMTWEGSFKSGEDLYVIVEACNRAGLCVTSSSLPVMVDSSPPLPGTVVVGLPGLQTRYLHDRTTLAAHWFNFLDLHSGIARYQWCLGTSPSQCDVTSYVEHHLLTSLLHGNLSLSANTDLYLRVRAFNKVGLSCVGVSDRFRVDVTPPEFSSPPVFLDAYSTERRVVRSQWEDSVFLVDWRAEDEDSPLVSQRVSVWARGSVRLHQSLSEFGVGRLGPYVIRPDDQAHLEPGDDVRVNVTACNAAGLCRQASSPPLLVDPTPPTVGGFQRVMNWTSSTSTTANVSLSWYGFEDAESGVRRYHVRVGRGYGRESGDLSGGTVVIDKGERATLDLTAGIAVGDLLVLTLWAENGVGLRSRLARVTVEAVGTEAGGRRGVLRTQRHSCRRHYCTGDCTCAVVGGKCSPVSGTQGACREVPARGDDVTVSLAPTGGRGAATASSSCLWGKWSVASTPGDAERYEWSAGLETPPGGQAVHGHGVFLPATEAVWHDAGSLTSFVHCLPGNRSLRHGGRYVAYVRAWYNASSYHVFTSPPLTVDLTPPAVRRGASVSATLEQRTSSPDFRYESGDLLVAWPRVFRDSHSNVVGYDVMVGSHPGGDDVVQALNVGSRENHTVHVVLHEGTPYHVTVVARNGVGLMTSHFAPPLLLDDEPPIPGVVFSSADYHDAPAQSSPFSVGASWHGFLDRHSAILQYQVAVVDSRSYGPLPGDFRSVGMATSTIIGDLSLRHAHVYRVHVRAVDSAGHVSEAAVSSAIRVDYTPAHAVACRQYRLVATVVFRGNSTRNSSPPLQVDVSGARTSVTEGTTSGVVLRLSRQEMYRLAFTGHAHLLDKGAGLTLQLDLALRPAPPGHAHSLILSPLANEELTVLPPTEETSWPRVVNVTRCPPSDVMPSTDAGDAVEVAVTSPRHAHVSVHVGDPESGVKRVMIGLGTMKGGFQIQPLRVLSGHVTWLPPGLPHATPIHVTAQVLNGAGKTVTFFSHAVLDITPPDLTLVRVEVETETFTETGEVTVSGAYEVRDAESDVTGCLYGLGSGEGSTSLIHWSPLPPIGGPLETSPVPGHHGDTLFLTLWCWNSLGLDTRVTSDPLPVYVHPPNSSAALVEMIADNVYSVAPAPDVQCAGGLVRMRWEGFVGDDVIGYQCRVWREGELMLEWTDVGLKNQITLDVGQLQENTTFNLTGEVRSYNANGQRSIPVVSTLLLDSRLPELTGASVRANLTTRSSLLLDWSDVFSLPDHQVARFTLALGHRQGASDLLPPTSVSGVTYVFPVPAHSLLRSFHVTVRATLPSGLSSLYVGVVQV